MPSITAPLIHNGHEWLPQGTTIELSEDGVITAITSSCFSDTIQFDSVIAPGFVNAHCHIELSHLKGSIPEHTTLIPFLQSIPKIRNKFTDEQKTLARHAAVEEMKMNGIVAVGDIANSTDTLDIRMNGRLHYHTFIESIGFAEERANMAFAFAESNLNSFLTLPVVHKMTGQSITPHAPYSVSVALMRKINECSDNIISIHSQESKEEDLFFKFKDGRIRDLLHGLGIDDTTFQPTGQSGIRSALQHISPSHPVLLVHNTYVSPSDIEYVGNKYPVASWCLCPNANLYIENRLPDVMLMVRAGCNISVGTDSLASNHQLSIIAELNTLKRNFASLTWETLLSWGTYNAARALQMEGLIGSMEVGKKPGFVHVTGLETGIGGESKEIDLLYS